MSTDDHNTEQHKFEVELYHDQFGRLGAGILVFGENLLSYVRLFLSDNDLPPANDTKLDLVKAVVRNEEAIFCLCECKIKGIDLYAEYVIEGDLYQPFLDQTHGVPIGLKM
ncbi:hypothetical protein LOC54_08250 [Acetobacter sp. AN02]|uniref:hypothetical protein n=1 Tax=Acetobacter sp. AN02 TaxID=2894186 RepID=UPI0024343239|nr:hypothetical protein [Acetobacter sp. AN02]MDG6095101.1 hypothetical protein [Acetobacter sp. AN02]